MIDCRPLAAAAALAALTCVPAVAQDAPRVIAQGPGYQFTASPAAGAGAYGLQEEVSTAALISALGGRSATAALTIDCEHRQSALGTVLVFQAAGAQGSGTPMKATAWMRASPVDLFDLTEALCSGQTQTAAHTPATQAPPAGEVNAASAPEPARAEAAAPADPSPTPETEPLAQAAAVATPASGRWVQVGAFASAALADAEGAKLQARGGFANAGRRIEPVARGSATLYRLLLGPYRSKAAAQAACAEEGRAQSACIVH